MINEIRIQGNIGKAPVLRKTSTGQPVVNFSVCTTSKWRDKHSGEWQEHNQWHDVAFFGPNADYWAKRVHKGDLVYIAGEARTKEWTKQGVTVDSYYILARQIKLVIDQSKKTNKTNYTTTDVGDEHGPVY